jgi:hypothetical protein
MNLRIKILILALDFDLDFTRSFFSRGVTQQKYGGKKYFS